MALHEILTVDTPQRAGPWFFPSPRGRRWRPDNLSQKLRETDHSHDLTWSCLGFRHTVGSHRAQKGASLYKIAELMGNSPETRRRRYVALMPEKVHAGLPVASAVGVEEKGSPRMGNRYSRAARTSLCSCLRRRRTSRADKEKLPGCHAQTTAGKTLDPCPFARMGYSAPR